MAYSVEKDIKLLWSQAESAKPGQIALLIERADNIINSALVARYTLPFDTTPPVVKSISEMLTIYYLKKALNPGTAKLDDDSIETYKEALQELTEIAKGERYLIDSDGILIAVRDTMDSSTDGYIPIFNLDDVKNHKIDFDRLEAIEDERD